MPASASIPVSSPCSSRSPQHAPLLPHACSTNRRSAPTSGTRACRPATRALVVLMRRTWRRPFHRTRSRCGFVSALPQPSTPEPQVSPPSCNSFITKPSLQKTSFLAFSLAPLPEPSSLNPKPETPRAGHTRAWWRNSQTCHCGASPISQPLKTPNPKPQTLSPPNSVL